LEVVLLHGLCGTKLKLKSQGFSRWALRALARTCFCFTRTSRLIGRELPSSIACTCIYIYIYYLRIYIRTQIFLYAQTTTTRAQRACPIAWCRLLLPCSSVTLPTTRYAALFCWHGRNFTPYSFLLDVYYIFFEDNLAASHFILFFAVNLIPECLRMTKYCITFLVLPVRLYEVL